MASATSDGLRAEWLDRDDRLRASMVVSTHDTQAAVAEVEGLGHDARFVQLLLPVRTEAPYGNRRHHPVYEAAVRHDLAIGLHAWGRPVSAPTPTGFATTYLQDHVSNAHVVQTQVLSLVGEGTFTRFPGLRVSLIECGFSWLPSLLWRFDKDWESIWRAGPWGEGRPPPYGQRPLRAPHHPPPPAPPPP